MEDLRHRKISGPQSLGLGFSFLSVFLEEASMPIIIFVLGGGTGCTDIIA